MNQALPQPRGRRCPTCGRLFEATLRALKPYAPFCSRRCQLIDLGKWWNEEYVISTPLNDPAEEPPEAEPPRQAE